MAEGFAKEILGDEWAVYSAGIEAHGVNSEAVSIMKEINIDISRQTSDIIDNRILKQSDLVITLCSHADQNCPAIPDNVKKTHWAIKDPAGQSKHVFRKVRDEIKANMVQLSNI